MFQIACLLEYEVRFTVPQIADILGVFTCFSDSPLLYLDSTSWQLTLQLAVITGGKFILDLCSKLRTSMYVQFCALKFGEQSWYSYLSWYWFNYVNWTQLFLLLGQPTSIFTGSSKRWIIRQWDLTTTNRACEASAIPLCKSFHRFCWLQWGCIGLWDHIRVYHIAGYFRGVYISLVPKKIALFWRGECIHCINAYYYISHIKYMAYGKINVTKR